MKLGIMQPYLFPYIGYFQLIQAVDRFIIYDDVAFIKQGWINRNNLLVNGQKHTFLVPVKSISSFKSIRETEVSDRPLNWDNKLLKTIYQAYGKAPFFKDVYPVLENTLTNSIGRSIAEVATHSIKNVLLYLSINKDIIDTSLKYSNEQFKSEQRIIEICKLEHASTYINVIGGVDLYNKNTFTEDDIELRFLKPVLEPYKQFKNEFIPGLSIIDVLMFREKDQVSEMMLNYALI